MGFFFSLFRFYVLQLVVNRDIYGRERFLKSIRENLVCSDRAKRSRL